MDRDLTPLVSKDVLERCVEKWRQVEGLPECTILRLSILREFWNAIHSEKSNCLARGRKPETRLLKQWEHAIEQLRSCSPLEGDLLDLIAGSNTAKKRTRLIPESLFSAIEREKLERYDRAWEAAIASEACSLKWSFWSLQAWVELILVEEWSQRLNEQVWPHGVTLFVETDQAPPSGSLWKGRWILVLSQRFKNLSDLAFDFSRWPGSPADNPPQGRAHPPIQPPRWKLLFTPKS